MNKKETFEKIFNEKISRHGAQDLLKWLQTTDFFEAPASTKYHGAYNGGLLEHSLNVYYTMLDEYKSYAKKFSGTDKLDTETEEKIAICALLHDLCKVNYYATSYKNVKNNQTGKWEKKPFYTVENKFAYGHGEKSVFLIERHMKLKVEEAVAIRWHMGGFDDSVKGGSFDLSVAWNNYPFALLLHIADLKSTYFLV